MSAALDPTLHQLNDCGCCEGVAAQTPVEIFNRPGLSAIAYRTGRHAQFKQTLLARLSSQDRPALALLTTRDADDFSIALLDAWATVADVLTFYQERIANESYLRTATERLSLLELARLIGYELRPGVAASAYLAFTIEEVPGVTRELAAALGVPRETTIDLGVKAQSVPGPGERAQMFETIEPIEARAEWNEIRPRLTKRQVVKLSALTLYFEGLTTGLKKGDGLLITEDDYHESMFREVSEVTLESERGRTKARLKPTELQTFANIKIQLGANTSAVASAVTQKFIGKTIRARDLRASALSQRFNVADLFDNIIAVRQPPPAVLALRTRASIFGHNAPRWDSLPAVQRIGEYVAVAGGTDSSTVEFKAGVYKDRANSWAETSLYNYHRLPGEPANTKDIYLDNVYPSIVRDSWLVLKQDDFAYAYQVKATSEVSRADYTLSGKSTRLTLDRFNGLGNYLIRRTTVHAQSEELTLARLPIAEPVEGQELALETWVDGLYEGQSIIVCGELDDASGVNACEHAVIKDVEHVLETEGFTRLTLVAPLENSYVRATVKINANVALATHGETVAETLGSGDAGRAFQRFTLRQPPLTYVSAKTPTGSATTLSVRVNGLLWQEVPTFYGRAPDERIYVTRTDDDGKTTVQFGDGRTGARLPTGQDNVTATYRKGTGLDGLVRANQLSQLMTRPLGVKGVVNPSAASGAADREARDEARRNAPLTVMTLERVVSLADYEDFSRAFAGVGKALATWTWNGEQRGVLLTVAGANGAAIESPLDKNLLAALRAAGDPAVPLEVASYQPRLFRLKAKVRVHPDYLPENVLAEVERSLRARFSFDARAFGQFVALSEVIGCMQSVAGVLAVDVDELYRTGETAALNTRLNSDAPRAGSRQAAPAELLTLDPGALALEVML
ncbi:MAG TPA: putative baseplate assembly protein [Pyrinomonadaceae bacterium]|nr:putative baseplate assembly protein [Pyrinomonadaceae bacterium]